VTSPGLVRVFKCSGVVVGHVKRATFVATYPPSLTHPLHTELVDSDDLSRADVLNWGPVGSATTLTWVDGDRDAATALYDAVDAVVDVSLVAGDGGTYAFTRQSEYAFADDLLDLVAAADVAFRPPLSFRADRSARFEAVGEPAAVSEFYDELTAVLDVCIESVGPYRAGGTNAALTDRQGAALEAAASLGYYEVPRSASVADVAEELDCASSTAGELLRNAEAAVVGEYVD
jgi:predicted DNA binding protein